MKNVFKRGLYSLIPQRESEDAEDVLDRIDEEDAELGATKIVSSKKVRAKKVSVVEESDEETSAQDSPLDEADESGRSAAPKPAVTLLTLDIEETSEVTVEEKQEEQKTEIPAQSSVDEPVSPPESEPPKNMPPKPESSEAPKTTTTDPDRALWDQHEKRVESIPLGDIAVNPNQPRRTFDTTEMQELVQSIAQHGILQPLVVRQLGEGKYELVAGERRLRAARQLGWERVPCVVRRGISADSSRLQLALIENLQRENLNPVEEAMAYLQLNEEYGMTHEEVGEKVGRSRVSITNTIRILQLPAEIQRGLMGGKISAGHARAILMIPDPEKQLRFYSHVVDEGLTVRRAETRARRIQRTMKVSDPERIKKKGRHPLALKYEGPLEDRFGYDARVRFVEEKNRFEITFKTHNEIELRELIARLLGTEPLAHGLDSDVAEE
jgi:ParB family chromosome partitioning protein